MFCFTVIYHSNFKFTMWVQRAGISSLQLQEEEDGGDGNIAE